MIRLLIPGAVLFLWAVLALIAPMVPLAPNKVDLMQILSVPGADGWFGFDALGRPVGDRLAVGARTSFLVAFGVVSVSMVVGVFIGTIAGWIGGVFDHLVVRIMDVFLAFPGILLAIALAGILGPGIDNVIIALVTVGWVGFARLSRAQVMTIRQREHVQAARALGSRVWVIVRRHLLPLIWAPIIVEATFAVAGVVIAEAGLSFLGLGVQPPVPSWGSMIRDGTRYMLVAPHLVLVPGTAILFVVLAVNLVGDSLRDRMDVRLRAGD
ncbi:MAG: ABC transporter permease [Gammaproteobacteria bacterium]|nr:MAG: ABC transporter permease [Gammaproteobacteria bacterium]